jgi:peptide/nickel transport system substrate-binding protein
MRHEDNYWIRRLNSSRLSRRRFVGTAAVAGTGAAAFGLVGCGDDDDDTDETATSTGTSGTSTSTGTATSTGTPQVEQQTGGVFRTSSANNTWDTFDADRTRFGPMGTVLNMTNQGIVAWDSYANAEIGGHFAESWEQEDDLTYTFKIREGLTWHNKPPVNGRPATAEDLVYFIERNKSGKLMDGTADPNFYRNSQFQNFDTAEAIDDATFRVTTVKPWPFMLNILAGTWTRVQAREAVEEFETRFNQFSSDLIIGTGSFTLDEFTAEGSLQFRRFDGSPRQPWLDGMDMVPLFTDQAGLQAAFEQKQIDSYSPSAVAVLEDIKDRFEGKIYEKSTFVANPVSGTWYGGAPPWSDLNLVGAMYRAMDRRALVEQLLQGRGAIAGYAPPAWAPFALPEGELSTYGGYLADHAKDDTEAKAMWEAGGGPALGDILVDIPDIYEGAYSGAAEIITGHLKEVLGNNFTPKLEPYATITSKIVAQQYGNGTNNIWWGWVNPPADPDMSVSYISTFKDDSNSYKQFEVAIPALQTLIREMETEFDLEARVGLCQEAEKEVLNNWGAGLFPLYLSIANILYHNYFQVGETTHQVTVQNYWRDLWFKQDDPSWEGRPA